MWLTGTRRRTCARAASALLLCAGWAVPSATRAAPVSQQTEVDIDAAQLAFPPVLPAGLLRITAENSGAVPAGAGFARLAPGTGQQQVTAALQQAGGDPTRVGPLLTFVGGIADLPPHAKTATTIAVQAGTYLLLGGGATPQVLYFSVGAGSGPGTGVPPATATVSLTDTGANGLPKHLPVGAVTLKVLNTGRVPHRLLLIGLQPGKGARDVQALLATATADPAATAWVRAIVGVDLLSPGQVAWPNPTLTRGIYVAAYPSLGAQRSRVLGVVSVP